MRQFSPFLIVAGGTGGHVMPALAVYNELKNKGKDVLFITDERGAPYVCGVDQLIVLPLISYQKSLLGFFRTFFVSFFQIIRLFLNHPIQGTIAFGGYVTIPVVLNTLILFKKLYLHEQNAVLGRVNRLFLPFARRLFSSTQTLLKAPDLFRKKILFVGMPLRPCILKARQETPKEFTNQNKFSLFVVGGSQGAHLFSEIVPKALALMPKNLQKQIEVVQQARDSLVSETEVAYEALLCDALIRPFFEDMPQRLLEADLVIARAGASTLGELRAVGRPALLIPFAAALDDHQTANAREIVEAGAGWMMSEREITPQRLAEFLRRVMARRELLVFAAERMRALCRPKATEDLVKALFVQ